MPDPTWHLRLFLHDGLRVGKRFGHLLPAVSFHGYTQFNTKHNWRHYMKIRPLNDRILVKRLEEEQKTKGGLFIPDSAKEKPAEGKVVAVGKGRLNDKGDR